MKPENQEENEGEEDYVSPSTKDENWNERSSFHSQHQSPADEDVGRQAVSLLFQNSENLVAKGMNDGFFSEVSTPDFACGIAKEFLSSGEKKRDSQSLSRFLRTASLAQQIEAPRVDYSGTDPSFGIYQIESENGIMPNRDSHAYDSRQSALTNAKGLFDGSDFSKIHEADARETQSNADSKPSRKRKRASTQPEIPNKRLLTGISEKTKARSNGQLSHLSEEEQKKLRRVKNRESVEKCRTKQRLRMEALQVEQTCLRIENKVLKEAVPLIQAALFEISSQMTSLTNQMAHHEAETSHGAAEAIDEESVANHA